MTRTGAVGLALWLSTLSACGGAMGPSKAPSPPGSGGLDQELERRSSVVDSNSEPAPRGPLAPAPPAQLLAGPPQPVPTKTEDHQAERHEGAFLIYTARLTMAVYQVEGALDQVERIGRELGGYLANRGDQEITIRVPRERFDEAIKKVEGTGDVIHRDISAQDVTDEFLDTEVRLKNARAMRDRLQQLLERATVKDALEIEKELGRITQEIEQMEGRLKVLKDKIAYSTITATFDSRAASLHTMPLRLPFAWLSSLGLPTLLRLNETK
jgi:hypothetical protein